MPAHTPDSVRVTRSADSNLEIDILRDIQLSELDVSVLRAALSSNANARQALENLGKAFMAINAMHQGDAV